MKRHTSFRLEEKTLTAIDGLRPYMGKSRGAVIRAAIGHGLPLVAQSLGIHFEELSGLIEEVASRVDGEGTIGEMDGLVEKAERCFV